MSVNKLTDEEKNLLLRLSYIDLPTSYENSKDSPNLERVVSDLALMPDYAEDETVIAIQDYLQKPNNNLADLKFAGYENNNPNFKDLMDHKSVSGFVGYAFEDREGNGVALFRGSESLVNPGHLATDWKSNVEAAMGIDIKQQREADDFYQRYLGELSGERLVMGHSKGGNLTSHVFVNNLDDNVKSYVINAAPIYWWDLSDEQKEALKGDRNSFIVFELDPVSQLGYVPYVDKVVSTKPRESMGEVLNPFYAHGLANVGDFDSEGNYERCKTGSNWARDGVNYVLAGVIFGVSMSTPVLMKKASDYVRNVAPHVISAAAKGLTKAANWLRDESIKIITKLQNVTRELKSNLNSFFNDMIHKAKSLVGGVAAFFAGGSAAAAEPVIKVDIGRLRYYAERLQNLKRRTAHLNDMVDSLYWEAGLLGLDNVLRADLRTSAIDTRITQSAAYLNRTAELMQRDEAYLLNRAGSVR
ncbi:Mbeg1-like protein [Mesobacillus foraminis]|uniref:DUF2974 family protein n=1 Tax=Mesobacillus foraminis TaxID=279826 RepID=A0A4R2BC86_9BACI|nr:Mbeg1-like protein [Mesobacillus foraminis]TCN24103.1 DUF2974 family protein [Mesobacillus foraminis]